MSKYYDTQVDMVLQEVEHILREEASRSQGVRITIDMGVDRVTTVSYEVEEKVVM